MTTPAVRVRGLGKQYHLGAQDRRYNTLRESLVTAFTSPWRRFRELSGHRNSNESFWALRDVDFDIAPGEVVGIIGHNGAGKSTLLKILSQITEPTKGEIELRGRVGSLLEVGTGFHPELTGRDNIYLNGAILGMSRAEVRRKFDEIVDFSGVESFLDTPVKRYSSGMHVRLAFAVAAHLEPEILIVDEVLAVGDAEFQRKCLGKMNDVARGGRTILFVSHNLPAVEGLCTRGIVLKGGQVAFQGSVQQAVRQYTSGGSGTEFRYDEDLRQHPNRVQGCQPLFARLRLTDDDGRTLQQIPLGDPITFEVTLEPVESHTNACIGIHILDVHSTRIVSWHSAYQFSGTLDVERRMIVRCRTPSIRLMPGQYSIVLGSAAAGAQLDRIQPACCFEVVPRNVYGTGRLPPTKDGYFVPEAQWSCSAS